LISPWRDDATLIATIANVQPEALHQRISELMVEHASPDFENAERALRRRRVFERGAWWAEGRRVPIDGIGWSSKSRRPTEAPW